MSNYQCEHGEPCEAGGHTLCMSCPREPERVRYRPTDAFHARTMEAMDRFFPMRSWPDGGPAPAEPRCDATTEGPAGAIPCTQPLGHVGTHVTPSGWQWRSDT